MHICKAAVASSPQLSAVPPNSTGKKNQENHHNSHKKQSVLKFLIHSSLSKYNKYERQWENPFEVLILY